MRIALKTLGCKVNQAESDSLMKDILEKGFEVVHFSEVSDLYIINGCAVTQEAERKTRQMVRQALRRNPGALVLLAGCAARLLRKEAQNPWDERVVVLTSQEKEKEILEYVGKFGVQGISPEVRYPSRVRSWVKVEDGCDHFCSYCIVPHLRGGVRSESPQKIVKQVQDLEEKGVREIVLCGINLGYFGRDISFTLIELLDLLVRVTAQVRFRLSSLEPFALEEDFLERYFSLGRRVCPHFHLPLQSGSDRILEKMGRGYDTVRYRSLVGTLRRMMPEVAVTTDVIVGFPGETEDDFQNTFRFCEEMGFSRMHVFLFSSRPGTPAFRWEKEMGIPYPEKKRREKLLLGLAEESRFRYHRQFLGKTVEVLVESFRAPFGVGYSENYIPVRLEGVSRSQVGKVLRGRIQETARDFVVASPCVEPAGE
jgi:threonylcarbamoyladenosine tRNA methylthiotransferase MtaB